MSAERWVALFIAFAAGTAGCAADQSEKARILARLTGAAQCKFGDCDAIGEGVSEMRINGGRDTGSIFSPRRSGPDLATRYRGLRRTKLSNRHPAKFSSRDSAAY